eukprot:sb/3475650/
MLGKSKTFRRYRYRLQWEKYTERGAFRRCVIISRIDKLQIALQVCSFYNQVKDEEAAQNIMVLLLDCAAKHKTGIPYLISVYGCFWFPPRYFLYPTLVAAARGYQSFLNAVLRKLVQLFSSNGA